MKSVNFQLVGLYVFLHNSLTRTDLEFLWIQLYFCSWNFKA